MATTWIKRFENRSKDPIALFNLEWTSSRGHGTTVLPGESIQVDMAVPWPTWPGPEVNFANKHLEIKINDVLRYCIWQSAHIDGDNIRFSTDGQYHDVGDHVHGYAGTATNLFEAVVGLFTNSEDPLARLVLTERTIVVLDSHFECMPIAPKPPLPFTTIKQIQNQTTGTVKLRNTHTNREVVVPAGWSQALDMSVPWAASQEAFNAEHLELQINGQPRFSIWQADSFADGDYVRFSTGSWSPTATHVGGIPATGISPADLVFTMDRTLVVLDNNSPDQKQLELWPNPPVLDELINLVQGLLHPAQMQTPQTPMSPMPSAAKKSATAFSIPGPSSDAYRNHQPNARFLYNDSGKRYQFKIDANGTVIAIAPDGTETRLDRTRSYNELREGKDVDTPVFDLIAANCGRVFAKAAGSDDFYWATMDENFIHLRPGATNEISVATTYFKLDPQFGLADSNSLLAPIAGIDDTHLAAERLPTFRQILRHHPTDMMIGRADPGVWQQLDFRPPQTILFLALRDVVLAVIPIVIAVVGLASGAGIWMIIAELAYFTLLKDLLRQYLTQQYASSDPPPWVATHSPVRYLRDDGEVIAPLVVKYVQVLDVGVGHVHLHQQYQHVVGGELQSQFIEWLTYVYRFFNGGVWDGDGYVDGTSNFYILVKYATPPTLPGDPPPPPLYGILYQDEQAYFSQRWRIVGPDDAHGGTFSIANDLTRHEYEWHRERFWCPFWARHINDDSRMAVSAQVILVTGQHPVTHQWQIYSINASWGTLDRSWRWRDFPTDTTVNPDDGKVTDESIPATSTRDCVYPQTIRLRDDMTLHVWGFGMVGANRVLGKWYQRYLPADNKPFPVALPENQMPPVGYPHKWKFLPWDVFRLADTFSHFGVFDQVNARLRYYDVTPVTPADAGQLEAGLDDVNENWTTQPWTYNPWVDDAHQLYISQWKFRWRDPRAPGADPMQKPSLFNANTLLRIVKRGNRWIAMMWDKRDDDLVEFERLPRTVTLKKTKRNGTLVQAQVTLSGHHRLLDPPMVRNAFFWWEADGKAGVAFDTQKPAPTFMYENVARFRMALLEPKADPRQVDHVTWLFDRPTEGVFSVAGNAAYEFRWMPSADERTLLQTYCTETAERQRGVSIWFENIVGNVAPAEQIRWQRSPIINATATPSNVPLGVPIQMTVSATDARTGAIPMIGATPIKGTVKVDGQVVGDTDTPFTFTFNTHVTHPINDPDSEETVYPVMTVEMPTYVTAQVQLTFYTPVLQVSMVPSIVANGPTSQVTVRAEDSISHALVAGRVILNSVDVAATNVQFSYPFAVGVSGFVRATGYPTKSIPFGLYTPQMVVSVLTSPIPTGRPVQITVRAIDSRSGALVNGRVKLDGVDVGATNTPFTYTFGMAPPTGVVSAQFYGDVPIQWPPLRVSTLLTSITPFPVPLNKSITATVRAVDSVTGELIAGRVKVNISYVGSTNTPFTATFRTGKTAEGEITYPYVAVIAPGYNDTEVALGV